MGAPGAYEPEKSEKYLEEHIQHSIGIKPKEPKKYVTPSPGAYEPEKSEKYLDEHIQHSICTITITIPVFVITYPNLTKMKRHVWYWCSRVPVSFPNQVFEKSTPLTTLCDTDRSALIKSNSVSDVE